MREVPRGEAMTGDHPESGSQKGSFIGKRVEKLAEITALAAVLSGTATTVEAQQKRPEQMSDKEVAEAIEASKVRNLEAMRELAALLQNSERTYREVNPIDWQARNSGQRVPNSLEVRAVGDLHEALQVVFRGIPGSQRPTAFYIAAPMGDYRLGFADINMDGLVDNFGSNTLVRDEISAPQSDSRDDYSIKGSWQRLGAGANNFTLCRIYSEKSLDCYANNA